MVAVRAYLNDRGGQWAFSRRPAADHLGDLAAGRPWSPPAAVLKRPCGLGLASVEGEHFPAASRGSGAGDKLPADLPAAESGKSHLCILHDMHNRQAHFESASGNRDLQS